MNSELPRLLAPVTESEFFGRYWAREHLHISGTDLFEPALYLRGIETLLQSQQLPAAFIDVYRDGTAIPVEQWSRVVGPSHRPERVVLSERLFQLYSEGSTLILNGAHRSIPCLVRLCRRLALEFGFPAQANIYVTPPCAQGFSRHADDHEVLVLQLHGAKIWTLYPNSSIAARVEIKAGDVLYIPAGLDHDAASGDAASVHVTIGLKPVYAYQLVEELAKLARTDPAFQIPLMPNRTGSGVTEISLSEKLNDLLSVTPLESLVERRLEYLAIDDRQGEEGRFSDLLSLPHLTVKSRVRVREDISAKMTIDDKVASVHFNGRSVTVPLFLTPTVERLLQRETTAILDIEGLLTGEGKMDLVRGLIAAGLLQIIAL